MSDVNTDTPQTDAGRIAATLRALSDVLGNSTLGAKTGDVTALQRRVTEVLTVLNTNDHLIAGINAADTFGTDPSLALQRARLTREIEAAKIDYQFEILPKLVRLTTDVLEQAKETGPDDQIVAALNETTHEHWTFARVVDSAQRLIGSASTAVGLAANGYPLVRALALLAGIHLPPLPFPE